MDELTKVIETSLEVKSSNNKDSTLHSRSSQYKLIERRPSNHDDRRRSVLEEQKQRRENVLLKFRGLFEEVDAQDEECMEWIEEPREKKRSRRKKNLEIFKQIMYSEWFLDVPCDFEINWFVKPCPVGKRTLLVAGHGKTLSYFKNGNVRRTMYSNLPGGSRVQKTNNTIVLDCIYNYDNETHYVLDVLHWNFPTLSSTAEFRFYWLKSKLNEISQLADGSGKKFAKIVLLPHYPVSELNRLMSDYPMFPENVPECDGLLFYHKFGFYEPGRTPLVSWIKPFMLPEQLNVPVNKAYLTGKDSEEVLQLVEKENKRYYRLEKRSKNIRPGNKMEADEPATSQVDTMEAS